MRFLFFLLLLPLLLRGQTESWTGIAFEHEVSRRWAYVIEAEHRRSLADAPDASALLLLAGNWRLVKNLSLTTGTRLEPGTGGSPATLRLFSDLNYKFPLGDTPYTLEGRLRYQQDRPWGENGNLRRVALRPRVGLATELSERFTLVVEYEGRFRFDRRNEWSRTRYTVGLEYVVSDRLQLEAFWRRENRINQIEPTTTTILGIYADYTLPDGRERKWKYRKPFGRAITW